MSRSLSVDAIILRTIDIGEADRFCILFTRQLGRRAARAKAVRKTGSRLGGIILPLRRVELELVETDHSCIITGAVPVGEVHSHPEFSQVLQLQQGIEMLLALTQDDEPLPAVFDLLVQFIDVTRTEHVTALCPFQLRLLHLLGILPAVMDDPRFLRLPESGKLFIESCTQLNNLASLASLPQPSTIQNFLLNVLSEELAGPLKSGMVAAEVR